MLSKTSFKKKTLFVCVTDLWRTENAQGIVAPDPDYARGCWYIDENKGNQCEWLVAVNSGVIVGMWEIVHDNPIWDSVSNRPIDTRDMAKVDVRRKVCRLKDLPNTVRKNFIGLNWRMYGPIGYSF
jgi:hypothetical protein